MEKPSRARLIQYITLIVWSMEEETRALRRARDLLKEGKETELASLCIEREKAIERTAKLLRDQFPEFQILQSQRFVVPLTSNN